MACPRCQGEFSKRRERRPWTGGVGVKSSGHVVGVKIADVWRVQGAKVNSLREEKRVLGKGVVRREGKVGEGR